jgi:RNA polymerase sigma factor (sigma-70 family)
MALRDLRILYDFGSTVGLTDRQLLERFQSATRENDHDVAELALTALVERHSALVWSVCRSLIRDQHDAEDAFQATFLILIRKAGSLLVGDTLGPWLHVVTARTALSVRKARSRRRAVERAATDSLPQAVEPALSVQSWHDADEVRAAIHAEITKIPEAFRAVIVLCDLEGLSYHEAALRLKVPLGTVQSRLARARRRLRRGLKLRGIHPSDAGEATESLCAPIIGLTTARGLPPALIGNVGRLGALIASDPMQLKATVSGSVRDLVSGGLQTMAMRRLWHFLVMTPVGVLIVGALLYADAPSGRAVPNEARQSDRRAEPKGQVNERIEIPSPGELRASSGRGKTSLYRLDENEERIPLRREGKIVQFEEVEREIHWAVITGVIDNQRVDKSLPLDDARPSTPGGQLYCRVELKRRARREDGSWLDWETVDIIANIKVLDHLANREAERVPEQFRIDTLVDPLPQLTHGRWTHVDVERFVPAGTNARADRPVAQVKPQAPQRDRPPVLMIRTLDFTVEPGRTYRYRAQLVLLNPRYRQGNPPDRKRFILGPWSEATNIVTVPAP